jgi:hypothetical protein
VLARASGDFVVSNVPLQLPVTFTVPSGDYYAQAFGRFGLYDHLLIPGTPPQVPYAIVQPETVVSHSVQTLTLALADTRPYWLEAVDVDGNPAFVNAWAASFSSRNGEEPWLTRLGQSYIRVLSTDLPADWPAGFPLRLSDTPPGVAFSLSLHGVAFSPAYQDFVVRHGSAWPADPTGGSSGFPLTGSADRIEYLAWKRPVLDASSPPTFTVSIADVTRYEAHTDIPGLLGTPWLGWETDGEGWIYPPTGAGSSLEPVAPGLTRTVMVAGAHHALLWAGDLARYRIFQRPFYTPDWTQTYAWDRDPDVRFPDETALQPLPPGEGAFTLGAGPLYPALAFDNRPGTVQVRHPLLAGATGSPVSWGAEAPAYTLTLGETAVASGTLPEHDWVPSPLRRWADLPSGAYELTITPTIASTGIEPGTIRAGFHLTDSPGADLNPPQVLDLSMPQRFEPNAALTATWTVSDANPVALAAAVRLGDAPWAPLSVEFLGEGRYEGRLQPGGALTVSLAYTATDAVGNWLTWEAETGATALAQVPVTLTFELDPPGVPWSRRPVTVRLVGSLLGPGGQPLAEAPTWLRLRAGGQFVGYVRDLTGSPGAYHTGAIDFAWSFIPADLADAPGSLPLCLEFDAGLYAPRTVTRTLNLVPPFYLPVIIRRTAP